MMQQTVLDRRTVLKGVGLLAAMPAMLGSADAAMAQEANNGWEEGIKKVVGTSKPVESKQLSVDLPEIAENGNTVPFTVGVESAMTEADFVKAIHIFSTGNPQALISTFHFTPESGKAVVSGRLRLARTQDIITIAEVSDGRFLMSKRAVKVTIGGCGG